MQLFEEEASLCQAVLIEFAQEARPEQTILVVTDLHSFLQFLDCLGHDPLRDTIDIELVDQVSVVIAAQKIIFLNLHQQLLSGTLQAILFLD